MMDQAEDPLQMIPVHRFGDLQEVLRSDYPRCILGYNVLETQKRWSQQEFDCTYEVFCPFGDVWNGMVAVNTMNLYYYDLVIDCPKDETQNLEYALKNTKMIDWTRPSIRVRDAPPHIIEVTRIIAEHFKKKISYAYNDTVIFDVDSNPSLEIIDVPSEISFQLLSLEHAALVDTNWSHRYPGSKSYLELLIKTQSGYGIFKNKSPVSWVFVNDLGFLNNLFTLEEHRREGYAELLIKILSTKLVNEKKDVFAYVSKGNESSFRLFKSVGFQKCGKAAICYL